MSKIKIFITIISVCIVSFIGCKKNEAENLSKEKSAADNSGVVNITDASAKEIGLTTQVITAQPFSSEIKIPATVITNQDNEALVGSLLQGRVKKVLVKIGDYVRAGQVLMLIEGLEVGEIKSSYVTAKANLDFRKGNFERLQTLSDQKITSQKTYLEAKSEYEKALAEFDAEDKKIHSIGLEDKDVTNGGTNSHISGTLPVKSPIDGVVVERNIVIGQLVEGNITAFKIINTSSVWIDAQVYENDIERIKPGSPAYFTSSSLQGEKFQGKVIYAGQTIDEKSRTIVVRSEFNNSKRKLKPQMFGELQIASGITSKAILIPAESIVKLDNADFVFVQKSKNSYEKRCVVTGAKSNELIEVKNGLKENETIVVKGAFLLKSELMKGELEGDE